MLTLSSLRLVHLVLIGYDALRHAIGISFMPRKLTLKLVSQALEDAGGLQSSAARTLGVVRSTICKWVQKHPELQAIQEEARQSLLDFAESNIRSSVESGDLESSRFVLRTLGASRGYVPSSTIQANVSSPVKVEFYLPDNGRRNPASK